MGRPTKLTEFVRARIIASLAEGNYRVTACRVAGVHRATFERWMSDPRPEYRDFRDACEKAEAQAEETSLSQILTASQTTWQAAAWFLERKYSERWGQKQRIEVETILREEARSLANELGIELDEDAIIAEATAILSRHS